MSWWGLLVPPCSLHAEVDELDLDLRLIHWVDARNRAYSFMEAQCCLLQSSVPDIRLLIGQFRVHITI